MQVPITIDETELVNGLTEPLAEAITESVLEAVLENENLRYAAQEAGSEAGSESGSESGWEAGREAAREEINDSDSGGLDWGSLRERMENEFTGRNYEGGCSEWRAYFTRTAGTSLASSTSFGRASSPKSRQEPGKEQTPRFSGQVPRPSPPPTWQPPLTSP